MEHVDRPELVLRELHRILKPGGNLIFHTPNLRNWKIWLMAHCPEALKTALARLFEGRHREDVYPTHYLLNTRSAIQYHAQNAGFILDEIQFLNSSATSALITPLALLELLIIRLHQRASMAERRSNIIAILRKPAH